MIVNRGLVFWGLALVTGGVVALAAQLGYIDRDALAGAWRLWPLVLVAIGLSIILARTGLAQVGTVAAALVVGFAAGAFIAVAPGDLACGGGEPVPLVQRQGTFTGPATVNLQFDCGTLEMGMTDGEGTKDQPWNATFIADTQPRIDAGPSSLTVSRRTDQWWDAGRQRWIVSLPVSTNHLRVEANAADSRLDLTGGRFAGLVVHANAGSLHLNFYDTRVKQFDLALNAGSAAIMVGPGSNMTGTLHANAGSIEICTNGQEADMRLTVIDNLTFSNNLNDSGLVREGDTWSTTSTISGIRNVGRLDLTIEGIAGSFTLNLEGGCA